MEEAKAEARFPRLDIMSAAAYRRFHDSLRCTHCAAWKNDWRMYGISNGEKGKGGGPPGVVDAVAPPPPPPPPPFCTMVAPQSFSWRVALTRTTMPAGSQTHACRASMERSRFGPRWLRTPSWDDCPPKSTPLGVLSPFLSRASTPITLGPRPAPVDAVLMTQLLPHAAHSPPYRYLDPVPYLLDSAPTESRTAPTPTVRQRSKVPRPPPSIRFQGVEKWKERGLVTVAAVGTVGYPLAASEPRYATMPSSRGRKSC
ncbi:hypothetical protein CMUS01_10514 [Colletotrichum musicola]|uniref:Uncharacterized protein n=1 Tax=Colletotrichum musicola TaxID=2175873 RepID=A0A8H6K2U3_9PEZI|nr:hypothetical protein CMUS01_10514 [Colletotrichum musicola]